MAPRIGLEEKWSAAERRKRAKSCARPKGFTMKQFCRNQTTKSSAGERKNESIIRMLVREALLLELRNAPDGPVPAETKYFARPVSGGYVLYYGVKPNGGPATIPGTTAEIYATLKGKDYDLTQEQIRKAEELVSLGIFEKNTRKVDYKDITFRYISKAPGSASQNCKTVSDVPDDYVYYGPKGSYNEYLLVDTDNKLVSLDATWSRYQARRGASTPKKTVKDKSYVMPSGDVAFVGEEIGLKKLFKHLTQVDPRVTPDYKIISPDDKYEGQTIGQAESTPRTTDIVAGGVQGTITTYHGTTTARWKDIEKRGMLPGKFQDAYADQIAGYSAKNIYFTMDPHTAENYATRAAIWYGGNPLILKVEIPDITKIVPDEDNLGWFDLSREYTLTKSDRHESSESWDPEKSRWVITKTTKAGDKHTVGTNQHFKTIMQVVRLANRSRTDTHYDKDISEMPEAGLEWIQDDEYKAMLKDVESKLMSQLTAGITEAGTFAYRGWIPPKFIKKWKEYPKKAYPKSVDTGKGGTGDEYQTTRQDVLKKVKRFDESLVRNLVRSMLAEAAAPNFASSVTHSAGWISPEGEYFYDPQKRDHGEWAAFQAERDPKLMKTFLEELKKETDPIPPPPPRTPAEQAVYDAKSDTGKRMDDWRRQGGRKLEGKPIPPYNNMGELYYSDIQSEVRSSALRALLMNGWGKVSNAYGIELWKPSKSVLETWMNLGMEAGSDPEMYHNVYDKKGSIVEGDWTMLEKFMRRLP